MKIAEMGGGREAGVADAPDPVIADNYAKVKVLSSPLCTEFQFRDRERRGCFGHEAGGEVVEVGPKVRHVAVGDRVVVMPQNSCGLCELCRSGEHIYCRSPRKALEVCSSQTGRDTAAQYVIQQDWLLMKYPRSIPDDHAAMACCGFGPSFNAMQSMEVTAGDTVLVAGLGPVGMGAVIVALHRGAKVIGVDVSDYRRNLVLEIGASYAFDPTDPDVDQKVRDVTPGGVGVHASVQCTRVEGVGKFMTRVTRARGGVAFIGQGGTLDIAPLVGKGLRLFGCWHWNHLRDSERMLATIAGSADRINKMITHTFPLSGIEEAFKLQVAGQCGKIVLHPWEE
ncbi:MAG: zinc-binding dehydrogenase [Phycisphaera sp.]|nr:zinc-binding dehydrogenase [Phycisphaera sp.]